MLVRVLGSAAGGGFPQWNCGCPGCRAARDGSRPCRSRTQSSVAVSGDHEQWFLVNASPDVREQIERAGLTAAGGRATPVQAVLLTDAELDHALGLLLLREAESLELHCTPAVREALRDGTGLLPLLQAYCPVECREVVLGEEVALGNGLAYRAFDAPTTKKARFGPQDAAGRVVGYRFTDERSGRAVAYLPGAQEITDEVLAQLQDCAGVLVDGTCWQDDEMPRLGLASRTAREMGHLPMSGPGGSLERLGQLPAERKIYVHVNNTNPVLLEDSPERREVERRGFEVATDGTEVRIQP